MSSSSSSERDLSSREDSSLEGSRQEAFRPRPATRLAGAPFLELPSVERHSVVVLRWRLPSLRSSEEIRRPLSAE